VDGAALYFTWRPEGGQADIWLHDIATGTERPVTCTSEEEYGATPTPDGLICCSSERPAANRSEVERACYNNGSMNETDRVPRLRPSRLRLVIGPLVGAAAGFAFYWFYGCDSG
jgi:hypothetical protein